MDTIRKKKKYSNSIFQKVIFIAILFGLFLTYFIYSKNRISEVKIQKERLNIVTVKKEKFHDYINVKGKIQPKQTIYLDAVEGGRVKALIAEEGSQVQEGSIILELENNELYQQILNSEVALAEKENYLRNTKISFRNDLIQSRKNVLESNYNLKREERNFQQQKRLWEKKMIAKEDYLKAQEDYTYQKEMLEINRLKAENDSLLQLTTMQTLEEDLVKMRETLVLVRNRLDFLKIRANTSAYLGTLDAEIGQSVSKGQHLGILYDLSDVKVLAEVDERYISKVKKGLKAIYKHQDTNYELEILRIYPEVKLGQFQIELGFTAEKPKGLRTGQTTYSTLNLGESVHSIIIPKGNYYAETGGEWIYVLSENGNFAEKRKIKIGAQNVSHYQILEGLKEGEQIILSNYKDLKKYDKVLFD